MALSANTRVGTANNLEVGGTYDLLTIKYLGSYPEGQISFGLYNTPMKITGLQKVAQVFLKVLMTSKGSDPIYPSSGTFFPNLTIGANVSIKDARLLSDLRAAIKDAESQTKEALNVNTSDLTSCLAYVQVLGLETIQEGVFIYLKLGTQAGEEASVAVPFPEFGLGA